MELIQVVYTGLMLHVLTPFCQGIIQSCTHEFYDPQDVLQVVHYECYSNQVCCGDTCCHQDVYSYGVYRNWYFWFGLMGALTFLAVLTGSYWRSYLRQRGRITGAPSRGRNVILPGGTRTGGCRARMHAPGPFVIGGHQSTVPMQPPPQYSQYNGQPQHLQPAMSPCYPPPPYAPPPCAPPSYNCALPYPTIPAPTTDDERATSMEANRTCARQASTANEPLQHTCNSAETATSSTFYKPMAPAYLPNVMP